MKDDTDAERARRLLSRKKIGSLCTIASDSVRPSGYPFGSVMPYSLTDDGNLTILASSLAEHTINFTSDARACMLVFEDPGSGDPLAFERVTLIGDIVRSATETERERYLQEHPHAKAYVSFADFSFYTLKVSALRYVGGFGRMSWVEPDQYKATTT
ncbi:MAG: HugZ family protein [Actinomycetota bacterium]